MKRTTLLTATATLGAIALTTLAFTTLALTAGSTTPPVPNTAGFDPLSIFAPHHDRALTGGIWFPSMGDGTPVTFAENPVFYGVSQSGDATIADGSYPVVILSHGMGGHFRSLAWLGAALAERGAIVVAVNHPNSSWGDFDLRAGIDHWTRAQDLSLALDSLMADPQFAGHIDTSRIMAAGFSYGGYTALTLGGLRGELSGYADHCAQYGAASSHCDDLAMGGVVLSDLDPTAWNASYADPRITHVTAIDPGLIWGLDESNLADITAQTRLIALGLGRDRLFATDFDQSGLTALMPAAAVTHFAPASHFMMLPLCKPAAEAILMEENDDPVCTDPAGADRAALHASVIGLITDDLGL